MVRLNETTKVSLFFVRIFVVFSLFTYIIKLPETAKDEADEGRRMERNMKKRIFCMLLTAAMCVSMLAACGSETKETAGGETSADSHSTSGDSAGNRRRRKCCESPFLMRDNGGCGECDLGNHVKRGGRRM